MLHLAAHNAHWFFGSTVKRDGYFPLKYFKKLKSSAVDTKHVKDLRETGASVVVVQEDGLVALSGRLRKQSSSKDSSTLSINSSKRKYDGDVDDAVLTISDDDDDDNDAPPQVKVPQPVIRRQYLPQIRVNSALDQEFAMQADVDADDGSEDDADGDDCTDRDTDTDDGEDIRGDGDVARNSNTGSSRTKDAVKKRKRKAAPARAQVVRAPAPRSNRKQVTLTHIDTGKVHVFVSKGAAASEFFFSRP